MSESWLQELRQRGWTTLARDSTRPSITKVLAELAATKTVGGTIQAADACFARPKTLSASFGTGRFPLHTDGANTDDPPRYLLLASSLPRLAATLVLDVRRNPVALSQGRRALFRVTGRRENHYARFLESRSAGQQVRYNPLTHIAANEAAHEVEAAIGGSSSAAERIDWTYAFAAIIDNWLCLHGREPIVGSERGRLHRLHVWTAQ